MSLLEMPHRRDRIAFKSVEIPARPDFFDPAVFRRFELRDLAPELERDLARGVADVIGLQRVGTHYLVTWIVIDLFEGGGS